MRSVSIPVPESAAAGVMGWRVLALNAERHAVEVPLGMAPGPEGEEWANMDGEDG
jgi:hypothetical protein